MFKSISVLIPTLCAAAIFTSPRSAVAQSTAAPGPTAFLNLNVGAQPQQREIHTAKSFTVYDETATVTSTQPIKNGAMFDVTGGYRLRPNFAVAAGVSLASRMSTSSLQAAIPDPIFTDRPRTSGATTGNLHHTELGIHLQAVWFFPVSDRIDVALSAGPSLFHLSQDLTSAVTVPTRTQNIVVVQETQKGTAIGFNAGFDGNYMFSPRVGLGLFARYAGASVDLPSAVDNLSVGGFQTGLGLRLRF